MSEVYTAEAWRKECAEAVTAELLHWNAVYVDAKPLGWTDDQIQILRDEIERRRPK